MRFPAPFCRLLLIGVVCTLTLASAAERSAALNPATDTVCYVGTYTAPGKSKGIYAFRLQTQNDEVSQNILLVPLGLAAESNNPAFLEVDLKRRLIFAINEIDTFEGKPTGAVSAFAIEPATGKLKLINQVASGGTGPCHLVLDRTGKNLIIANYGGGSVAVIPVAADGRLGAATTTIQHKGHSVNPQRQQGPHAHCATLDPENRFAFICDLGLDQLVAYRFDAAHGKLTAETSLTVATKPGAGPRHMAFRPDGKFAYVINELNSTVTAYSYDAASGKLTELQTESSLPPSFDGKNSGAEIAVHPSGRWLYASNRGNETVVLFDIDKQTGKLSFTEDQSTGGKTPRHFGIQPNAKHLAIANQNSDSLLICRIDDGNGRLKPSGVPAECPVPVCVVFVPPVGK
jgi:6-phosphogluconolactonase